ncbi:MAG: dihydroorotate dehydrogenase, partial [Clostridia bacterium]|nr:dihydroorotate dehydrogenase [Clostridia bacterium]
MVKDLSVWLGSWRLDNPVIPASGTFAFGAEHAKYYDLNVLGSIAVKGTTILPRDGNPSPRIAECPAGLLNSVGLQNPGAHHVAKAELKEIEDIFKKPVVMNVSGFSERDYVEAVEILNKSGNIGIFEINISCPNVHGGGMAFGTDP